MEENLLNSKEVLACSLCGEALTPYGSRRLSAGWLCRHCAEKVSQWYTDEILAEKSLSSIKRHLAYREENLRKLKSFDPTLTVDGKYSLYIDEARGLFVISKRKDYVGDNSDVLRLRSVKGITVYDLPGEADNICDVMLRIDLSGRQIKRLTFRVNEFAGLETGSAEYAEAREAAEKYLKAFTAAGINERKAVR